MKKLCLVITDLHKGGMERVMSELAYYFSTKSNTEVHLILLTNQSRMFYKVPQSVIIHNPPFVFDKRFRLLSIVRTIIFLRKTIQKVSPDAVLSFGETYNSFVLLSTLFLKIRIFVSDRSKPDKRWGLLHEYLRRKLYRFAAGVISQTKFSKSFLAKEIGHNNIEVIPNPVKEIKLVTSIKENAILNIGRLIKSKRIDLLLEIFSNCDFNGWELWLVGEGDQKENLVSLAQRLKISENVKFLGKQENVDIYYSKAKIFAFTSESEGLPNGLIEAMSAGLACISFDCVAGPSDLIINGENGFLIDMYNCPEFVSKLNILIHDDTTREIFSKNARKISSELSLENIGSKYYKFLLS